MPHGIGTKVRDSGVRTVPHLERLVDFAEPATDDVCLDLACGAGPLPAALAPRVRLLTTADIAPAPAVATARNGTGRNPTVLFSGPRPGPGSADVRATALALPYRDGAFTLVTARFCLYRPGDPARTLPEMVRVVRPGGRLVVAEVVRPDRDSPGRGRIEMLRDPGHPGVHTLSELTGLLAAAGAAVRRLDLFTVERPLEPWLAEARDRGVADGIRDSLLAEVDGGPRTGARPRVIGGELWFAQTWAHLAAYRDRP